MSRDHEILEAIVLCRKLVDERQRFFDKYGVLNSDGRKLLNRIVRIVMKKVPQVRAVAVKARREPILDNILRFLEELENLHK
ncbi:MAG: hypothetical protein F7C32_04115 [Desulfurococcales archaeon]|nr:hypothetical protein [Desulfurococcales archaeon]